MNYLDLLLIISIFAKENVGTVSCSYVFGIIRIYG